MLSPASDMDTTCQNYDIHLDTDHTLLAQAHHKCWVSDPLQQLDAEAVDQEVQAAYKVLYKVHKVCDRTLDPPAGAD